MISLFNKLDRTSTPTQSVSIPHVLSVIKNPSYQKLILLARCSGKNSPTEFIDGTYYFDFDQYQSTLRYDYVVKELNKMFENTEINIVYFSENFSPSNLKSQLDKYAVKYSECIQIQDFYSFFEYKKEGTAFISMVWGGYDTLKQEKTGLKGEFKVLVRNLYSFIKSAKIPVVTWNACFDSKRTLKSITGLSGYMYMDVDQFDDKTIDETYNILTDNGLNFVKAVWKSFGGTGLGFLVQVDGLSIENFKWNWVEFSKKFLELGIKIDKATKDATRTNVLSFDENIFIRETCVPLVAIENQPENQITLKVDPLKDDLKKDIIEQTLSNLYYDQQFYQESEDRLSYRFYQILFSKLNQIGITIDETFSFLQDNSSAYPKVFGNKKYNKYEILNFAKSQYDAYSNQFGTITVEQNQYVLDDYTLIGIYKAFQGDLQLKMNDLFEKAAKKEEGEVQATIVYFALNCKRVGILINDCLNYIEKKFGYNPQNKLKLKKIYSNSKYPFGVQSRLKATALERKRSEFIARNSSDNKKVILHNGDDSAKHLANVFKKIFGQTKLSDNNVSFLCKNYFKECNSYGISLNDATKFLNTNADFHSIERYSKYYGKEIYENSQVFFGIRIVDAIVTESKKKIDSLILINDADKLLDLELSIDDNTILWADTGMGKTTLACSAFHGKRIILVPTIGALKNIETKYNAATFYEANKNVTSLDQLIVCTYSSAPKLFSLIQTWSNGLSEYTLIVDEQHNLAVSSAKDYRNSELNYVMDNIHLFKKRIFMTGTLFPVEHPAIKDLKIKRIKWATPKTKNAKIVWVEDKIKTVEKNLVRGKKNIIYLQDKRMHKQLGKLVNYLKSKNWDGIYLLNANEKNEAHFKNLITNEYLESDAQVIITTSVAVEAINILDLDVETVHFITFENPRLMEQLVNRMRKKLPSQIFIYKKKNTVVEENINLEDDFDSILMQEKLIKQSENLLNFLAIPKNKKKDSYSEVSAQKLFANQIFEKSMLFRVKCGINEWAVDYLAIANKVFNEETIYARKNFEYFKSILDEYGWIFSADEYDNLKFTEEEKIDFKEKKTIIENEMHEYSKEVLKKVESAGLLELKREIENKATFDLCKYPDIEWDIRIRILKLSKYMDFTESCRLINSLIVEYKSSEEKFNRMMREISVKIAKFTGVFNQDIINFNSKFSQSVIKMYFEEKRKNQSKNYSLLEVSELFNRRKRFSNNLVKLDGEKMSVEIFSKYFELIPTLNGTNIYYKFGGLNIANDVSNFTKSFYDWAQISIECDQNFNSNEIAVILNKFRENLPFLSKIKLDAKQSLKLLEDYVTIKKTSKRIGDKVSCCYKIAEIEPVLTKGYEIKINQEVITNNLNELNQTFEKYGISTKQISAKNIRNVEHDKPKHISVGSGGIWKN